VETEGRGVEEGFGYFEAQMANARLMKGVYRLGKASMWWLSSSFRDSLASKVRTAGELLAGPRIVDRQARNRRANVSSSEGRATRTKEGIDDSILFCHQERTDKEEKDDAAGRKVIDADEAL